MVYITPNLTFYNFLYKEKLDYVETNVIIVPHQVNGEDSMNSLLQDFLIMRKKLLDNNVYKNEKNYRKQYYYDNRYIRSSYTYNYLCYGCYFGYSKKPCKLFIPI